MTHYPPTLALHESALQCAQRYPFRFLSDQNNRRRIHQAIRDLALADPVLHDHSGSDAELRHRADLLRVIPESRVGRLRRGSRNVRAHVATLLELRLALPLSLALAFGISP